MIVTGAISDPSNSNCYECHVNPSENCDIHSQISQSYEPYVNYLCCYREINVHGEFYENYVTEDTGYDPISDKFHARYAPCEDRPTNDTLKL